MSALGTILDVLGWGLALVGVTFMLLGAIGLHRFDDPAVRLHVAAKASSAGVLALLTGAGIVSGDLAIGLELALTGVFLVITVPLATHGLGRAVVRARAADTAAAAAATRASPPRAGDRR